MKPSITERPKIKRKGLNVHPVRTYVHVNNFLAYHKRCLKIIKKLKNEEPRLALSICLLGFESLSKMRYPRIKESSKRFLRLLQNVMSKEDAENIYYFYRTDLIHTGMLNPLNDTIEDLAGISDKEPLATMDMRTADNLESDIPNYPSETFASYYYILIEYIKHYFKKNKIKYRIIQFHTYSHDDYL